MADRSPDPGAVVEVRSAGWDCGPDPEVAVAVSTFRRPTMLAGLLEALADQDLDASRFEVVVADNGSGDATWDLLASRAGTTGLRLTAVGLPVNRGPGGGRNAALARVRAPVVAFTDDDCLPEATWLRTLAGAMVDDVVAVQGAVAPVGGTRPAGAPWHRSVVVSGPSPFYETSNIAYRRDALLAAGGFDEDDPLTRRRGGRAFGEDALLGMRVVGGAGRAVFCGEARVAHRWLPGTWTAHLRAHRELAGFPALAARSPAVAGLIRAGVFLNVDTASFDLAVAGVVAAAVSRRPVALALALPWVRRRWPEARSRAQGSGPALAAVRLAQLGAAEAVGLAALVRGSVRHRQVVL